MTTIGYGDLTPHTYGGRVVMTFTSLISLVLFGLIVNQVCSTLEPGRIEKRLAGMIEMREARNEVDSIPDPSRPNTKPGMLNPSPHGRSVISQRP